MTANDPNFAIELVESTDNLAEIPTALKNIAEKDPSQADHVFEALVQALQRVSDNTTDPELSREQIRNRVITPTRVSDPLCELICRYSDRINGGLDALARMTAHEDESFRREAFRCLGCLGIGEPVDTNFVADTLAGGLDDEPAVQRAALWGLTKLAIVDPAAITPVRDSIITCLSARPETYRVYPSVQEIDYSVDIRRYAAEVLAANARAGDTPGSFEDPFQSDFEPAAAWAIQNTFSDESLPQYATENVRQVTQISEGHGVAEPVVAQLVEVIETRKDTNVKAGAVFALGCLVPWQPDFRKHISFLNDIADQEREYDESVVEAAQIVFANGPFISDSLPYKPEKTQEMQVTVKNYDGDEYIPGNGLQFPSEMLTTLQEKSENTLTACSHSTFIVEQSGTAVARYMEVNDQTLSEDEIGIQKPLRDRIDASLGESVTVRKVPTEPARKITLALPVNAPIGPGVIKSAPIRSELYEQRFSDGGMLTVECLTELETFGSEYPSHTFDEIIRRNSDITRVPLPIRVISVSPKDANTMTPNTEIEVHTPSESLSTFEGALQQPVPRRLLKEKFNAMTESDLARGSAKNPEISEVLDAVCQEYTTRFNINEFEPKDPVDASKDLKSDEEYEIKCSEDGDHESETSLFPSDEELERNSVEVDPDEIPEDATSEDLKNLVEKKSGDNRTLGEVEKESIHEDDSERRTELVNDMKRILRGNTSVSIERIEELEEEFARAETREEREEILERIEEMEDDLRG